MVLTRLLFLLSSIASPLFAQSDIHLVVLVLSQDNTHDHQVAVTARNNIARQFQQDVSVLLSHSDFGSGHWGHYAIWPLIPRILEKYPSLRWLLVVEPESTVNGPALLSLLASLDHRKPVYMGHGLVDKEPVITHHYYGFGEGESGFEYADMAAGILLSRTVLDELDGEVEKRAAEQIFTIDVKHELAKFILKESGARLQSKNELFCLSPAPGCVVSYEQKTGVPGSCTTRPPIGRKNLFVAIKTFSGYHRSRVVVVKRTWTKNARIVEYYSDIEDQYVPTKTLGVNNTERGHCAKTVAILKHFLEHEELTNEVKWLLIADDDTLIGLTRLYRLLRCYDPSEKLILGERYGYGYNEDGTKGYDYPTGGAGMVFSRPAVEELARDCQCPSADAPDDMIIGACARRLSIPVVHSAAFHQARVRDYARPYLTRIQPVSFHKFEEIDPYEDFMTYLHEAEDDVRLVHEEL